MHTQNNITFIVSYRDRKDHLDAFVPHYNEMFPNSKIVVVEQMDDKPFRRGNLLNIGFLESENNGGIFDLADVDMLAVEGLVDFSYPKNPAVLATQASQFNYKMPYPEYFSGHVLVTGDQMRAVNGYSNRFVGWGSEDNNFYDRFVAKGFTIEQRYPGRFISLPHTKQEVIKEHYQNGLAILKQPIDFSDGLSSCVYNVISIDSKDGYIHIKVEL